MAGADKHHDMVHTTFNCLPMCHKSGTIAIHIDDLGQVLDQSFRLQFLSDESEPERNCDCTEAAHQFVSCPIVVACQLEPGGRSTMFPEYSLHSRIHFWTCSFVPDRFTDASADQTDNKSTSHPVRVSQFRPLHRRLSCLQRLKHSQ